MKKRMCIVYITVLFLAVFSSLSHDLHAQDVIKHTVKSGDTLSKLAKKYLGDEKFWHELAKYNELSENIGPNEQPPKGFILWRLHSGIFPNPSFMFFSVKMGQVVFLVRLIRFKADC